jgi:glycosyltransferase involved in cell wall biosynthesis
MAKSSTIDLVVPTLGRTVEVVRFLESLTGQTWSGQRRVILVDQNPDDRVSSIVHAFLDRVPVLHLRSEPGVSRACNVGFRHCSADLVGRADDDCWYPSDALERVVEAFEEHPGWDALCGLTCDESGRTTQLRWDATGGIVTRDNIFRRAIGSTLFLKRSLVEALGDWDESYGPRPWGDGAIYGGSEDGEYLLRILTQGFTLGYEPAIRIFHADFRPPFNERNSIRKAYFYGLDHSRLLRQYDFPWWYASWRATQLVAGSAFFLVRGEPGRARFYAAMARGRFAGVFGSRR